LVTSAVKRAIIESELMEAYHWLPQEIRQIPYRQLQEYYIVRRQQREIEQERQAFAQQVQDSKGRGQAMSSGQAKRF